MTTWTIGKRINLGFAAVLILLSVVALTSFALFRDSKGKMDLVVDDGVRGIVFASRLRNGVAEAQLDVLRLLLAKTPEEKKPYADRIAYRKAELNRLFEEYEKKVPAGPDRDRIEKIKTIRAAYVSAREQVISASLAGDEKKAEEIRVTSLVPAFNAYQKETEAYFDFNAEEVGDFSASAKRAITLGSVLSLVTAVAAITLGIVVAILITRSLVRALSQMAGVLDEGSHQVAAASTQIASASQKLAEGASDQAASLEETSASLEEIASMTKRNAENAENALSVAGRTRAAADAGALEMEAMNTAVAGIKTASDNISKIIKAIDEIAFQTNILALNAAVEAARAGEAGMGFAVVADEVRNLAQRAASAARETSAKIQDSISKSDEGVRISAKVAASLGEIVAGARQVNDLVTQIATASKEQSQGILQVNTAVSHMDKVVQNNAASAEESASASEELSAQAASTAETVGRLLELVGQRVATAHKSTISQTKTASVKKPVESKPAASDWNMPPVPVSKPVRVVLAEDASVNNSKTPAKGKSEQVTAGTGNFTDF